MRLNRVLVMMILLASAATAGAQPSPPFPVQQSALPQPYYLQHAPRYFPPSPPYPLPRELDSLEAAQREAQCPAMNGASWYIQTMQEANAAWQRLRGMCTAGQAKAGCCEQAVKGAGCAAGEAGCAKSCELVQAPKSCCCAKACACCEMCKAKAQQAANTPMTCPAPLTGWKMQPGNVIQIVTQALPVQRMTCTQAYVPSVDRPAKLVTPDFEAHCEHMTQRGDSIELSGNVLLLCKKHAQPLRVEAQRVILNLKDGSFTVEANSPRPATVLRLSITEDSVHHTVPAAGHGIRTTGAFVPSSGSGIIQVVPVPTLPTPVPNR